MSFESKTLTGFILLTGLCSLSIFGAQQKSEQSTEITVEEVYRSIRSDNQNELGRFLLAGATNISNSQKTTPLHYAALYGSLQSMAALLAAGADPNARDLQESTPLI